MNYLTRKEPFDWDSYGFQEKWEDWEERKRIDSIDPGKGFPHPEYPEGTVFRIVRKGYVWSTGGGKDHWVGKEVTLRGTYYANDPDVLVFRECPFWIFEMEDLEPVPLKKHTLSPCFGNCERRK